MPLGWDGSVCAIAWSRTFSVPRGCGESHRVVVGHPRVFLSLFGVTAGVMKRDELHRRGRRAGVSAVRRRRARCSAALRIGNTPGPCEGVGQSEEHGLPIVPRDDAHDELTASCQHLARNAHQAVHERAELATQQVPLLRPPARASGPDAPSARSRCRRGARSSEIPPHDTT